MTDQQRTRMMTRFDMKRRALTPGGTAAALCKIIITMLGYSASVRTINARSRKFHNRYGVPV